MPEHTRSKRRCADIGGGVLAASSRPTGWPREALTALPQGAPDPEKGPSGVVFTLVRQAFVLMSQSQFSPLCRRRARANRDRT